MNTDRIIHIGTTEDAVITIAALGTRVIAAAGHPGHNLEQVGRRILSDKVMDTIRDGYNRRISEGATPKEAIIRVGQSMIAHYCNSAGIPTDPTRTATPARVYCLTHPGAHDETTQCQDVHEIAPAGPEPRPGHPCTTAS